MLGRNKKETGKAAKYTRLFSVVMVVAMVLGGFVGIVSTDIGSRNAAASVAPSDATYEDVENGLITMDEVRKYMKSEPFEKIGFDIEDLIYNHWAPDRTVSVNDEMQWYYENHPNAVFAHWTYCSLIHPELIASEASAASSVVEVGSVPADIILNTLDGITFISDLASREGTGYQLDLEYSGYDINAIYAKVHAVSNYLFIRGDVNMNWQINVQDLTYEKLIFFDEEEPTPTADANNDGAINSLDYIFIKRMIYGEPVDVGVIYIS